MKNKTNAHQHGRSPRTFEEHRCNRGSSSVRKGKAWRFFDAERRQLALFEPHFRVTARAAALDGKHMRSVRQPVRASHLKDL